MMLSVIKLATSVNRLHSTKLLHHRTLPAIQYINYEHHKNQQRSYKNFGHKAESSPLISKVWYTVLGTGFVLAILDYKW